MTTVKALKNLYVELGGNLSDVENLVTIPDMLNALAEVAGSTIELPAVSSTDNGDVLTVVEGKWAKAEAPEELPAVTTSDEGNALIVDSEGKWAKSAIPSQLPEVTNADAGDVLTVDSEGKWAKATPSGGGSEQFVVNLTGTGSLTDLSSAKLDKSYADILSAFNENKDIVLYATACGSASGKFIQIGKDTYDTLLFESANIFNPSGAVKRYYLLVDSSSMTMNVETVSFNS